MGEGFIWGFFGILFTWEKKNWLGPCRQLVFYFSPASLFLEYQRKVVVFGSQTLAQKYRRPQCSQRDLSRNNQNSDKMT